jgi:hypothetical protein
MSHAGCPTRATPWHWLHPCSIPPYPPGMGPPLSSPTAPSPARILPQMLSRSNVRASGPLGVARSLFSQYTKRGAVGSPSTSSLSQPESTCSGVGGHVCVWGARVQNRVQHLASCTQAGSPHGAFEGACTSHRTAAAQKTSAPHACCRAACDCWMVSNFCSRLGHTNLLELHGGKVRVLKRPTSIKNPHQLPHNRF